MTVLAAIRIPGKGCVLAADSRVTAGSTIVTDTCNKTLRCGSSAVAMSGCDGNLLGVLANCRSWEDVLKAAFGYQRDHQSLDWSALGYDARTDRLWLIDSDEHIMDVGVSAVGGCGGNVARGYLDAHDVQQNLADARALAVAACRAAIRRDSACGGRVRALVLRTSSR